MDNPQTGDGFSRFLHDWKRIAFGLPLEDETEDAAPEGLGTLTAQAMVANIVADANVGREFRAALADTQRRLHRPGRLFA